MRLRAAVGYQTGSAHAMKIDWPFGQSVHNVSLEPIIYPFHTALSESYNPGRNVVLQKGFEWEGESQRQFEAGIHDLSHAHPITGVRHNRVEVLLFATHSLDSDVPQPWNSNACYQRGNQPDTTQLPWLGRHTGNSSRFAPHPWILWCKNSSPFHPLDPDRQKNWLFAP